MQAGLRIRRLLSALPMTCVLVLPAALAQQRTGLEGTISRGPTQPVCQVDQPCDAPFVGRFTVSRHRRVVTSFLTDAVGHFVVYLPPGQCEIVPKGPTTVIGGGAQKAIVGRHGLTHVDLVFDTGIR